MEKESTQSSRRFHPFLDSSPRWLATVQLDQARRYARCTLHEICTDDSKLVVARRARSKKRETRRKDIALWKIPPRLKPNLHGSTLSDHSESSRTSALDEGVFVYESLLILRNISTHPQYIFAFLWRSRDCFERV